MRLEELCTFEWRYDREGGRVSDGFAVLVPYGDEGVGYGEGRGPVTGRLAGRSVWSNHPRRRGDGRMLPDVHGLIETDDGARIVFDLQGRSVFGPSPFGELSFVGWFASDDARYVWLNDTFCVAEGEFRVEENRIDVRVFVAVAEHS